MVFKVFYKPYINPPGPGRSKGGVHDLQIVCHDFPPEFWLNRPGCLPVARSRNYTVPLQGIDMIYEEHFFAR